MVRDFFKLYLLLYTLMRQLFHDFANLQILINAFTMEVRGE